VKALPVLLIVACLAAPAAAQEQGAPPVRPREENTLYMQGQRALNAGNWQTARFNPRSGPELRC
jgi:outer membrane protein assembly factor BamD (BamD/ComL family)